MSKVEKISISLPAEMVQRVNKVVDGGQYATVSEMVRSALRREFEHAENDRLYNQAVTTYGLDRLREMVQEGIDSLEKEGGVPIGRVRTKLTARYRAVAKAKSNKRRA